MKIYRKRLAKFIKQQRGDKTVREFSRQVGLSAATLNNLENRSQNITLDTLEHLCKVFKCEIQELFPK